MLTSTQQTNSLFRCIYNYTRGDKWEEWEQSVGDCGKADLISSGAD